MMSKVDGYAVRDLIKAVVGANSQIAAPTTVYIWFLSTQFLDIGGSIEVHAPPGFLPRCHPQVVYVSLPAGGCKFAEAVTSESLQDTHHSLILMVSGSEAVMPNTAYEFGIS